MAQSKQGSLAEAVSNAAIGFGVNFTANILFLPLLFEPDAVVHSAVVIGVVFTVISVARSYIVRRVYNKFRWFSHVA